MINNLKKLLSIAIITSMAPCISMAVDKNSIKKHPIKKHHAKMGNKQMGNKHCKHHKSKPFILQSVKFIGNNFISSDKLSDSYNKFLGKKISENDIVQIIESVTTFYNDSGYIASYAIEHKKDFKHGILEIEVIEGGINEVYLHPDIKNDPIVLNSISNIKNQIPFTKDNYDHNMMIIKKLPGIQAVGFFDPAEGKKSVNKNRPLDIVLSSRKYKGAFFAEYDNENASNFGRNRISFGTNFYDTILNDDEISLVTMGSDKYSFFKYGSVGYKKFVGNDGANLKLDFAYSDARSSGYNYWGSDSYDLYTGDVTGHLSSLTAKFEYPIVTLRNYSVNFETGVVAHSNLIKEDGDLADESELRLVDAGIKYEFSDNFEATNILYAGWEGGFDTAGAKKLSTSSEDLKFNKIKYNFSRFQPLSENINLLTSAHGQQSSDNLFGSEKISFGGKDTVRGFQNYSISGDSGYNIKAELEYIVRFDQSEKFYLTAIEPYIFYDYGNTYKNIVETGEKKNISAASTGAGMRVILYDNFELNGYGVNMLHKTKETDDGFKKETNFYAGVNYVIRF